MKIVIVVLLVLLIVAVVVAVVVVSGRRKYQRYSGLEHQRAGAKRARDAGVQRLKEAERRLVEAQRALVASGKHDEAQAIERLRLRLTTVTDRHRYATYGYAPLGSPTPIQEGELAELQTHDVDTIGDADLVADLSRQVAESATLSAPPNLAPLERAIDHLIARIDERKALS